MHDNWDNKLKHKHMTQQYQRNLNSSQWDPTIGEGQRPCCHGKIGLGCSFCVDHE